MAYAFCRPKVRGVMGKASQHAEWLNLVEASGPFLAIPVLEQAFPQGLDIVETPRRQRLRSAYDEWSDAVDVSDPLLSELHREWIRLVFAEVLEFDGAELETDARVPASYAVASPERTDSFGADWAIMSPSDGKPRVLVSIQPPGTDVDKVRKDAKWPASVLDRMIALCRTHGVRLGLITDGERWTLVNAPLGATSGRVTWSARLWFQEPLTLKAFQSLLNARRCFGPANERLEALLDKSLDHQGEVTDTLGEQVRRAVEVLVQCLDKADADRNRDLLQGVSTAELYEAGLTVMMRLVFVLCAEERGLLLLGDPIYDDYYAVSTLRGQLAEEADRHGPEVLDRHHDAWARLLSVFRALHSGIDHESLRMPALGGSLFDPDRFPFLEGRPKGSHWRDTSATPLPIDNRTILLLLDSLQILDQSGGALLLSYGALDVEQIGHIYEGLLEYTVARVPSVTVGLIGSKNAKNPNLTLPELESALMDGTHALLALLEKTTKRSESAIRNALARPVDDVVYSRLTSVCGGDTALTHRIRPFANLLRTDAWNDPIVYREGSFMVTLGADRRETGTHYTPRSLTESIVKTTLEPIVYLGPAEGEPRERWLLRSSDEILDLKICDPAMGSGAFLVQTCRWLAERLVEAWGAEEAQGGVVTAEGEARPQLGEADPMPSELDERLIIAKRLIAERCLYGVDVNPLAVELAKMSIWLITLAKDRPFAFLDHNLRHGDSLLGIHRLDQLTRLRWDPDSGPYQQRLFGKVVRDAVGEAVRARERLRAISIHDIDDVHSMARLATEATKKVEAVGILADAMVVEALRANGSSSALDSALEVLASRAEAVFGETSTGENIPGDNRVSLPARPSDDWAPDKNFHWPLEFPEVFVRGQKGFDAILSNPPYISYYGRDSQAAQVDIGALESYVGICLSSIDGKSAVSGRVNTFLLFIVRAVHLMAARSRCTFVLPDTIVTNESYMSMRETLTGTGRVRQVIRYVKAVFSGSTVGTAVITFGSPREDGRVRLIDIPDDAGPCKVSIVDESCRSIAERTSCTWLPIATKDIRRTALPETGTVSLSEMAYVKDGINPGPKQTRERLMVERPDGDPMLRLCMEGSWITPFVITIKDLWIRYDPSRLTAVERRAGASLRQAWIFDSPRIVYRQTAPYIVAAVDMRGLCTTNSVHNIILKEPNETVLFALLAYLNSTPFRLYYQATTGETRRVFPQVHISSVKQLLVPSVVADPEAEVTQLLAALARSVSVVVEGLEKGNTLAISQAQLRIDDIVRMILSSLWAIEKE